MNSTLIPINIYGGTQYINPQLNVTISKIDNKWFGSKDNKMFNAGFCNINCISEFFNKFDQYEESLSMLGYYQSSTIFIHDSIPGFLSEICILDDGVFQIKSCKYEDEKSHYYKFKSKDFNKVEQYILDLFDKYNIDIFVNSIIESSDKINEIIEYIQASISTRELSKNLVRVKSSNIWSYGINIKDRKDKTGNVIVQFKDKNGGPGDLYEYFDIPVNLWRKWLSSTSKGNFLWRYIRHDFKYRKLTGDKRGKLPNAVN